MKRISLFLLAIVFAFLLSSCDKVLDCSYNGNQLKRGPKGGCYYVSDKGAKVYVDRSACQCD